MVAPETDQSGAAHSLTLHEPLRLRKLSERVFAVKGTPTDCVIMGVRYILQDDLPTLVLSGVNRGANLAEDVTYSGTIAGAIEGTMLGIPSIAMSLAIDWEESEEYLLGNADGTRPGSCPQAYESGLAARCFNERQFPGPGTK